MTNENIDKIEETLAHQEQQIHDLSEMVIAQGHDIDSLKKQIGKLQDKINVMEGDEDEGVKNLSATEEAALNKPPHY